MSAQDRAMPRRAIVSIARALLAGGTALAVVVPGVSLADSPVSASGRVSGSLHDGSSVVVTIRARDDRGWQAVSAIDVVLLLRGRPLDRVTVDPSHSSLTITGRDAPQALGLGGTVRGAFFRVDSRPVPLAARGPAVSVTIPLVMLAPPPPGAASTTTCPIRFSTRRACVHWGRRRPRTGSPGERWSSPCCWRCSLGGFIGTVFTSRRRRPPPFSVYDAVRRRMAEEAAPRDPSS